MSKDNKVDTVTGVEMTAHEWDGIRELNKPLPRWWLLTFYACIIWAIGYWIAYPAWPTLNGYTKGMLGYSQRATVMQDVKNAAQAQSGMRTLLAQTPLAEIAKNPELFRFATTGGSAAFQTNCAPCHGRGAQGAVGYPNLNDDEWLWGGRIEDIEKTIQFGIRSDHKQSRGTQMPRFGTDNLLQPAAIDDVAEFVLALSGTGTDKVAATRGEQVYKDQCVTCHGTTGQGSIEQGAPSLADKIWLYGGRKQDVVESIRTGRGGVMPAWAGRLEPATIKALAVYVHSLGGGK